MKWLKNRKYVIDVQGHIHVLNNAGCVFCACVQSSVCTYVPKPKPTSLPSDEDTVLCMSLRCAINNMHFNLLAQCVQNTPPGSRELRYCHWQHLVNTKEVEMLFGLNKTKWNHLHLSHPRTLPCMLAGSTRLTHFNCTRSKIRAKVQLRSW